MGTWERRTLALAWGPLSIVAIGTLAFATGDSGMTLRALRSSALLLIGSLSLIFVIALLDAVQNDRLHDLALAVLALTFIELVALSAWLALIRRWATIRR